MYAIWEIHIRCGVDLCKPISMKTYLKRKLKPFYLKYDFKKDRKKFKEALANFEEYKIVVGSSGIFQDGWIPSEIDVLNLLKEDTWANFFEPASVSHILAEHVWEHLNKDEGVVAAKTCYRFLKKQGRLRIAVPDGYHSDPNYIEYVKVGGTGQGADDHKILYNYQTLSYMLKRVGFQVDILEFFDESGQFHHKEWGIHDGFIHRSLKHDKRNSNGLPNYTSLIIDAIKV